jgi:ABC-2 type transport system ATP-binding protein
MNNNINTDKLQESVPESIPYREIGDIKNLFNDLDFIYNDITKYIDCVLVKFYRSGIINLNIKNIIKPKEEKDWIIKTENLFKKYKGSNQFAVNSLNLSIKKGTIFGLLGPNGAGKTTTLSILCGLLEPTSGKISFHKSLIKENLKKTLGYIPQELALYPRLTGKENLMFFGKLYKIKGKALNKRVDELLSIIGLEDKANILIKKYSTGMKRRLNLAVGLINSPKIILMDEPTVGIDPQSRNHIFELIHYLKKSGVTILYTTHYMEEADKLCDTVAIMDKGKILIQGNPKALVEKYGSSQIIFKINRKDSKNMNLFKFKLIENKLIYDVEVLKNKIIIKSINAKDNLKLIEDINSLSKKFKIDLSLMNVITPNLENLFLDLTGKTLRDSIEEELEGKGSY